MIGFLNKVIKCFDFHQTPSQEVLGAPLRYPKVNVLINMSAAGTALGKSILFMLPEILMVFGYASFYN